LHLFTLQRDIPYVNDTETTPLIPQRWKTLENIR
jgi:hypothetical protein